MKYAGLVILLALIQFLVFTSRTAAGRSKHKVNAPATSGNESWERLFRVQQNTMEQLVMFIPALWLHAYFVNPHYGAVIGAVWIVGRFVYRSAYLKDPQSRAVGFTLTFVPSAILLIWTLVVAVGNLL